MTADKLVQTLKLGRELLNEFGLDDWKFDLSNEKVTLGRCDHSKKLITFSTYYLHEDMSEIEETIRHEIAHALVGPLHGHDWIWRQKCLEVGAKPERLAGEEVQTRAQPNYMIECTGCGQRWPRHRLKKKAFVNARSVCCSAPFKFYRRTT